MTHVDPLKSYWPGDIPRPVPGETNTAEQSTAIVAALDARKLEEQVRCGIGNGSPVDAEDRSYWPQVEGVARRFVATADEGLT